MAAMRESEHLAVGDLAPSPARMPFDRRARRLEHHRPGFLLVWVSNVAQLSLQHRGHHVRVAPFTERPSRPAQRFHHRAMIGRKRLGKQRDYHLLKAPAPYAQVMNRLRTVFAQNLGQKGDALAQPLAHQLLELRPSPMLRSFVMRRRWIGRWQDIHRAAGTKESMNSSQSYRRVAGFSRLRARARFTAALRREA